MRRESEEKQRKEQEESERQRLEEEARMSKLRLERRRKTCQRTGRVAPSRNGSAEEQRLAELEAAKLQEEMESSGSLRLQWLNYAGLEREGAMTGDVQISLMWENYNDLDLHVVCPSGERIHGGNKKSECNGELDVDANVRPETKKPVENVVWPGVTAPMAITKFMSIITRNIGSVEPKILQDSKLLSITLAIIENITVI